MKVSENLIKLNTCGISPKERKYLNCCLYNENIYLFGSPSRFSNEHSETLVFKLNLKTEEWTAVCMKKIEKNYYKYFFCLIMFFLE